MTALVSVKPAKKAAPRRVARIQFARAIETSASGEAPEACRLWKAGWNRTDKGDLNFTPKSAQLVMDAHARRGNPIAFYYEHEDRIPLAQRGGAPMRGVCSAPSSMLSIRDSEEGPECWAESIAWTDEAKRQIATGERRQISPIAAFDSETREIVEILNVSLVCEGATHNGTILASAGKNTPMDELLQALLDAVNAGDFEAAENIVQQMEATEGGAATAAMAKGMMAKMSKAEPAAAPPPPPPEGTATKTLAASRAFVSDEFSRGMARLDAAVEKADAAAKRSDRATVITLIAASRDLFDAVDEREHINMADPAATERHIKSLRRKVSPTGILAASKGAPAKVASEPESAAKVDATFGLSEIEQAIATESKVTFEEFSRSKANLKNRGVSA